MITSNFKTTRDAEGHPLEKQPYPISLIFYHPASTRQSRRWMPPAPAQLFSAQMPLPSIKQTEESSHFTTHPAWSQYSVVPAAASPHSQQKSSALLLKVYSICFCNEKPLLIHFPYLHGTQARFNHFKDNSLLRNSFSFPFITVAFTSQKYCLHLPIPTQLKSNTSLV